MDWLKSFAGDTAGWSLLVGGLMPLLIAVVHQPKWSAAAKSKVAVGAAVVGGIATAAATGGIGHGETVVTAIGAVLLASQTAYHAIWRPTQVAPAIEFATARAEVTVGR